MSRRTQVFVWSLIVAMALVAVGMLVWRADALANLGGLTDRERSRITKTMFGLVFLPAWLAFGTLFMTYMLSRPKVRLANDQRRAGEISLVAATILVAGVQAWVAAGAVLGEPPGREFGARLIDAIAGVFFIVNANFAAKTSPPQGWPDPGRWIRATLGTGWAGVTAGLVILASAVWAPIMSMGWIAGGATLVYVLAAVLNHVGAARKPA
jgi:hypothetical protein